MIFFPRIQLVQPIFILLIISTFAFADLHPNYNYVNLKDSTWELNSVGGMDWLPDGRLVVLEIGDINIRGDFSTYAGKIHFLSGVMSAISFQDVTVERDVITGLWEPLGLKVKDGDIYIHMKSPTSTRVMKLTQSSGYKTLELFAEGWGLNSPYWWHTWPGGLVFHEGYWHISVTARLNGNTDDGEKGAWIKLLNPDGANTQYQIMANGMRSNEHIWVGPWGELFSNDNQGNWLPDDKIYYLREGRWYGYTNGTIAPQEENPPLIYCPHPAGCWSPLGGIYLKKGMYAGMMFVGDLRGFNRVTVQRINNELQGTVYDGSTQPNMDNSAPHRWVLGPDGETLIYGGTGGWWVNPEKNGSLIKMVPKDSTPVFELLNVRSTGRETMELEFSQPLNITNATDTYKYIVSNYTRLPSKGYGDGKRLWETNLVVTQAAIVPNTEDKKIVLTIPGLSVGTARIVNNEIVGIGYTVEFNIKALRAANGDKPYDERIYYTLNQFGPGEDPPEMTGINPIQLKNIEKPKQLLIRINELEITSQNEFKVEIFNAKGENKLRFKGRGPSKFSTELLKSGLYIIHFNSKEETQSLLWKKL